MKIDMFARGLVSSVCRWFNNENGKRERNLIIYEERFNAKCYLFIFYPFSNRYIY